MNHISVEELASSLTELRLHPYKSKASTWWFYQGALPSKAIVKVEHRKVGEDYVQVTGDAREFLRPYVEEELLRMGQ
ncbi:hypothetical protein G6F68_021644 [Rhizopus microsporus]|nr:hypothetical protein G6F68_021644 [Rhizopus microsporus]